MDSYKKNNKNLLNAKKKSHALPLGENIVTILNINAIIYGF